MQEHGKTGRVGLNVYKHVACLNERTGTFRKGSITRYKPIRLYLGEQIDARFIYIGKYEGNMEKGQAAPFVMECTDGGEAAVVASITDEKVSYTFWLNMP